MNLTENILKRATQYATEQAERHTDEKQAKYSFITSFDTFLLFAGWGIVNLMREISNPKNNGKNHPFDIRDLQDTLIAIEDNIAGMWAPLADQLVAWGVLQSKEELQNYLSGDVTQLAIKDAEADKSFQMIGVVGRISSGKGTVGQFFEKKYGGNHTALSDRLRVISLAFGGDISFPRNTLREIDQVLKPIYGKPIFVSWAIHEMMNMSRFYGHKILSTDGFRSVEEALEFKRNGGILVGVEATQQTRFDRLQQRARKGDDDWEKFLESDRIEGEWIDPIFEVCDFKIDNNGSQQELEENLEELVKALTSES